MIGAVDRESEGEFDETGNPLPKPIQALPYMPPTIRKIQLERSLTMQDLEMVLLSCSLLEVFKISYNVCGYDGMFKPRFFRVW